MRNGIVCALVVEILFFWSQSDKFMTVNNIRLVFLQVAIVGIIAVPVAFLLMSGYIDFSMGSVLGFTAAVMGIVLDNGSAVVLAIAAGFLAGAVIGGLQGFMSTKLNFSPIIVTLGFFVGVQGLTFVITDGKMRSGFPDAFTAIGQGRILGVPNPVWIMLAVFALGWIVHTRTRWGRYTVALGVNAEAAHRAGISRVRIPFWIYVAVGLGSALAGLIAAARLNSTPPTLGDGTEIDVLAAVLLGGVTFGGGRGSLVGVLAGVLFIGLLNNGLILLGAPPFGVRVSSGVALVVAAGLSALAIYVEKKKQGTSV
jgi:ribose/xylose/arabinose/galactoside ABC-type transport system permease subunit